jgi:hypothetical protein
MIVYSDRKIQRNTSAFLASLGSLSGVDLLIAFGQFEAGVVDALSPVEDRYDAPIRALRYAAVSVARAWAGVGRPVLSPIAALDLPETIEIAKPEGYAFYAVYPEMYAEAAQRFLREVQPKRSVVIGIRSIGASLSAVVAATVEAAMGVTLRPRGHPFDRHIRMSPELGRRLQFQRDAHFLVVDEGPGISGSSFAGVARALGELGIPDDRIVLFPSWDADAARLRSCEARERWGRHRRFTVSFEETVLPRLGEVRDMSAGRWRELVYTDPCCYPAVQPQHERRKYLREGSLLKFEGLGGFGVEAKSRASLLAAAGFSPAVRGLSDGFLETVWEEGRPLTPGGLDAAGVRRLADYLVYLRRTFPVDGRVRYDELTKMIETNAGAIPKWDRPLIEDAQLVAMDGRMLPHEWISTGRGLLKTDGVDHHADHFFPGTQDIAWDLAGAIVELAVPREALVSAYLALMPDRTLTRRLPFYLRAYLAYRLGYARMAQEALAGEADGERFRVLGDRYGSLLRQLLF